MAPYEPDKLLLSEIRDKVAAVFGYRPCLWQIKVVRAILKRDRDIVSIAATGSGKTLTFWMPLLFVPDGIQIVVTPLNILGKQNVDSLAKVGISAITITAETATPENFQAIADGRHRAIVTNIETLMKPRGGFENLWNNKTFASKVISIVWDEAQCVSKWGTFRPEYKIAGSLRYLLPKDIPFYITSATLPPDVLEDVMSTLGMREGKTEIFTRSNDRSNIFITVRKMKYPLNSFKDLTFLIPKDWDGTTPLPYKFTIFFDNITESLAAAKYLRSLVPPAFRDKIKWFNSEMSPEFRAEESDKFNEGQNFGLCCTESFGMGIDLPNITLVIQWRATCDMCTLWQRFGRGARDPKCEAIALFLVEPMYFDETKEEKAVRKAKRQETAKKKRKARDELAESQPPAKKTRSDEISRAVGTNTSAPLSLLTSRLISSPPRIPRENATVASTPRAHLPLPLPAPSVTTGAMAADAPAVAAPAHSTTLSEDPELGIDSDSENESDVDAAETLEKRRQAYRKDKVVETKKKRKDGNELSPEMDDMINAGSGDRCIKCFRVPGRLYFGSDRTVSDHRQCRDDLPDGCPRCAAKLPRICCELCNPSYFESFAIVELPKPPPVPQRSRIKAYQATAQDMSLRNALHEFRRAATTKKFSRAVLKNSGPGVVMSNEVLQRIVDCAHWHKIESPEQLEKETRWAGAAEFGEEVIILINEHCPRPAAPDDDTSAPLGVRNENQATSSTAAKKSRKCSKCDAADHIASNKRCPLHPNYQPPPSVEETSSENIDPQITPSISDATPLRPHPRPLHQPTNMSIFTPMASSSFSGVPMESISWPVDTPARIQPALPIGDASPFPLITPSHFYYP